MKEKWMSQAVDLALENIKNNQGGAFGAIVVKNGKVVGIGKNQVGALKDLTAHAEVQAIRDACRSLDTLNLSECEIYSSCEPCPMCLSAIYWSGVRIVHYACTKEQAAEVGCDDAFIYEQLAMPMENRAIKMERFFPEGADAPFRIWKEKNGR